MIQDILNSKKFNIVFSVLIGIALAAILKPMCKGDSCMILKAPPVKEVNKATYQLGGKCYQFRTQSVDCPSKGVIEAFEIKYN